MKISVIGLGYIGVIKGIGLAKLGHKVIGYDINPAKVALLNTGTPPFFEADLPELLGEVHQKDTFKATNSLKEAVANSDAALLCVGTPSLAGGSTNLREIKRACRAVGTALSSRTPPNFIIAICSTVPPSTIRQIILPLIEKASGRRHGDGYIICAHPEFLREGAGFADFFEPTKIIVGQDEQWGGATAIMGWYHGISSQEIITTYEIAELVKYCDNAFHSVKITFANEIGLLAKSLNVDSCEVMRLLSLDTKLNISPAYLKPGFAFGGSCLPKDLRSILAIAKRNRVSLKMLQNILPSNQYQIKNVQRIIAEINQNEVGIVGLSFKPGTDDLRESPAWMLAESLLEAGYSLGIYDPRMYNSSLLKDLTIASRPMGSLLITDLKDFIARVKVLIIADGTIPIPDDLLPKDMNVIDLVGNLALTPTSTYHGLYW